MDMEPKTEREHIISLQGHITGVKREIEVIKTNHLAHLDEKISHVHEDVEKLGGNSNRSRQTGTNSSNASRCYG
jgi:L-lactate utilization protein LutB